MPSSVSTVSTSSTLSVEVPTSSTPSAESTPEAPIHRIAVRTVDGVGAFFDTATGERFVPRGMNYNRFLPAKSFAGLVDSVLATSRYQPEVVEADFAAMAAMGFNTVRVMIDTCDPAHGCIARSASSRELDPAFVDDLVDLLERAKANDLVVMVASNTLPDEGWWVNETARLADAQFDSSNNEFLNPAAVPVYVDYWTKVVAGLVERGAPTDVVLGYELRQEHHFDMLAPPLSLTSGTVTTANGETYDMTSQADKNSMIDEGLVHWSDLLRDTIRNIDPTALVTVGFFTPNSPNPVNGPDETRLVRTAHFLRSSEADFVDLHHYAGNGVDDADIWENFGIDGVLDKPLILGEHGAFRHWYADPARGAAAVMGLEVEACRVGFDGFILWAWRGDDSTDLWWAVDGAGEVAEVVAPIHRPDPCEYGEFEFIRYNLALAATATASSSYDPTPAINVNDGRDDIWNALDVAPQWIELALVAPGLVDQVTMRVAQDPPGRSVHELWIRQIGGAPERVKVFDGVTSENDVLTFIPAQPLVDVDLVRVVTTALDGDLAPAWHEIEILSPRPPE